MKNNKGFTLLEIMVTLSITLIIMVLVASMIINSMGYFQKTASSDFDKQAAEGLATFITKELKYASEFAIDANIPEEETETGKWQWLYVKDGRLYQGIEDGGDDQMLFGEDYYNNNKAIVYLKGLENYQMQIKTTFVNSKNEIAYYSDNIIELMNLKVKYAQDETYNPFRNDQYDSNASHNMMKIYYKKGTLETYDEERLVTGTVADQIQCKTEFNDYGILKSANNIWFPSGTFVHIRDTSGIESYYYSLNSVKVPTPLNIITDTNRNWKKINMNYDAHSGYIKGDIVYQGGIYYKCIVNTFGVNAATDVSPKGDNGKTYWLEVEIDTDYPNKNSCMIPDSSKVPTLANKMPNITLPEDYDSIFNTTPTSLEGNNIFATHNTAIWMKVFTGNGAKKPGEFITINNNINKKQYLWQKIQMDWDAGSAYVGPSYSGGNSSFSTYISGDIVRYGGLMYRVITGYIANGLEPAKYDNGEWKTNTGWERVEYRNDGNVQGWFKSNE